MNGYYYLRTFYHLVTGGFFYIEYYPIFDVVILKLGVNLLALYQAVAYYTYITTKKYKKDIMKPEMHDNNFI